MNVKGQRKIFALFFADSGYSLDARKDKLKKYAEFQNMVIAGEYSDEGKSGKNVEGRPEFLRMLNDIETGKDKVEKQSALDKLPKRKKKNAIKLYEMLTFP